GGLRVLLLGVIVVAAATLPYVQTIGYEFVWDDHSVVGQHLDVRGPRDIARIWNLPFDEFLKNQTPERSYFRPATLLSLAMDRAASGESPRGFHRTNVLLHAAVCFFLWLFAWEVSGRPMAAAAGAVLFAFHPTHPESVSFVSGRTDLLAAVFLFAALWAAVRFGPAIQSAWLKLLPAAALLLPGLYAKEVAFLAAPLLPVALWIRDRRMSRGDFWRALAPLMAVLILYLASRFLVLGPTSLRSAETVEGTAAQIFTSVAAVARYLPLLLTPLWLSARHVIVESRAPDAVFLAGLVALAAVFAGLWVAGRRRSPWLLPIGLFALTLLPMCYVQLHSGAIVAERFLFVPSGAIAIAVALLPGVLAPRRREADAGPAFLAVSGAVAACLLILLLPRVAIWKNEGTLFGSMLRDSPESPRVHSMLGEYQYRTRNFARSIEHYRRAMAIDPASASEVLLNLAAAEDESGQADSALAHIRILNRAEPAYAPGWYALGNLHSGAGRLDSAAVAYREAIRLDPSFAHAENNLGAVLERMGQVPEAKTHYRRALVLLPTFPEPGNNLRRLAADSLHPAPGEPPSPPPSQ
ncbi:MAG TPA: tetratricopeptide repeat protein, partial [Candidatus Eisenbacteria bacterium]|nr:tetratricopeptide repeat protein [Candidatus Eisenbacteria bacterium]